jgi:hypothetical protein
MKDGAQVTPIVSLVRDADQQTRDTRVIFDIPEALGVVAILNEGAKAWAPDTIRYGLSHGLWESPDDQESRYANNTGFIVLSELHEVPNALGQRLLPLFVCTRHGSALSEIETFSSFADDLLARWAAFNNAPLLPATHEEIFKAR